MTSFYRVENWSPERVKKQPEVTQPGSGEARTQDTAEPTVFPIFLSLWCCPEIARETKGRARECAGSLGPPGGELRGWGNIRLRA